MVGIDDESLYRAIRISSANSSARFSTLLEDAGIVVAVAKSLLGEQSLELCPETVQRIADDIAADHVARRSVASARRIQRQGSREQQTPTKTAALPSIKGTLQLRRRDDALSLEASFPPIEPRLVARLRRALRRRRYAPRLWGVTTRIPSEQLLSSIPFALKLMSVPPGDSALLPGLVELDIEEDLRETLHSFDLNVTPPLLFAVGADNEVARLVRASNIAGHRTYWLLTTAADSPSLAGFPTLGEVGPFACYVLDPTDERACQALSNHGFVVGFGVSVAFAGAPPLVHHATIPAFLAGDRRIVVPRRSSPNGVLVEVDGHAVRAGGDEVVRVVVPVGEHVLRVSSGLESRDFVFRGVPKATPIAMAVCGVSACSSDLTVQALLSGSLAFTVESFAPLEGLELTVEIEAGGHKVFASAPLGHLPQTITSELEPFASLLDDATRELLIRTPGPIVRLRVGRLCERTWTLEHRVRPCWWVRGSNGRVALSGEMGELPFGEVDAATPHYPPAAGLLTPGLDARLLVPFGLSLTDYGEAASFTTFCAAPKRVPLDPPAIHKPPLWRRRRGERGAVGLEDLVEAYLRWSLAECDTVIAAIRRKQITSVIDGWIAEICCGPAWCELELHLPWTEPWGSLVDLAHKRGLGRDEYVDLPERVWLQALEAAITELRRELPELWSLARPPYDISERDWRVVELAFERAYESVGARYRKSGDTKTSDALAEADFTADNKPEEWRPILETVSAQSDLLPLASLLLPSDAALGFVIINPTEMSIDEFCEELTRWVQQNRRALAGGPPNADTFRAIVALWTEPEAAVRLDWRGALDTMLAERAVARAARYLALRRRQARRGGVG
ncbi:MAG: hypothetical protein KDK91_33430 [Gammaproteobacteria bacterium]|nr:hypothetical protein [Gammaproteobacteria bacterium]